MEMDASQHEVMQRSKTYPSSVPSAKKKLAPRSSLQFKVGPQFTPTVSLNQIVNSKGEQVYPVIAPRIDRGFERIENEWVGYKRNYFTLVSTFYFDNVSFPSFAKDQFYFLNDDSGSRSKIKYFGLRLISRCAEDKTLVTLVQHTAKRDRGPQFAPPIHPAIPSELPDHDVIREAANVRNSSKIAKLNSIFFFDRDLHDPLEFDICGLQEYPQNKIIKVARYERIQFSSSINHKKPLINNKHFRLVVELVGFTETDEVISLAYTETPPLIVRGRSPSNYQRQGTLYSPRFTSESFSSVREYYQDDDYEDFETFAILKNATAELNLSPQCYDNQSATLITPVQPSKKKRGRKPKGKLSTETSSLTPSSVKKPKKSKKDQTKTSKVPSKNKARVLGKLDENEVNIRDMIDNELLKVDNERNNLDLSSLARVIEKSTSASAFADYGVSSLSPRILERTKGTESGTANRCYEDNYNYFVAHQQINNDENEASFNSSLGLGNLFAEYPFRRSELKRQQEELNNIKYSFVMDGTLENYEHKSLEGRQAYDDDDILSLKNRLDLQISKDQQYFDSFTNIQPSAMMEEFEEGPSFIEY